MSHSITIVLRSYDSRIIHQPFINVELPSITKVLGASYRIKLRKWYIVRKQCRNIYLSEREERHFCERPHPMWYNHNLQLNIKIELGCIYYRVCLCPYACECLLFNIYLLFLKHDNDTFLSSYSFQVDDCCFGKFSIYDEFCSS